MMKTSWVVCALLANMSFEHTKATQIAQTESRYLDGNLMQLECCPAKGCATAASDSSSSSSSSGADVQESDEEPEHSEFFQAQHRKIDGEELAPDPDYTYLWHVREARR